MLQVFHSLKYKVQPDKTETNCGYKNLPSDGVKHSARYSTETRFQEDILIHVTAHKL